MMQPRDVDSAERIRTIMLLLIGAGVGMITGTTLSLALPILARLADRFPTDPAGRWARQEITRIRTEAAR